MQFGSKARKSIRYSFFVGVLAGFVVAGSGAFAVDPTPISTQAQLEAIGANDETRSGDYFLDFEGIELLLSVPTNSTYITGVFTGTFDGKGKTLLGLTKPLFDEVNGSSFDDKAHVTDLVLVTDIGGVEGNGVLANSIESHALIEQIEVGGKILTESINNIGGLTGTLGLGFSVDAEINESISHVEVTGKDNIGGLVGVLGGGGQVKNSAATNNVSGENNIGGLVGQNYGGISNSEAHGNVAGLSFIGGLMGAFSNMTTVSNSISTGNVTGVNSVGGFVGEMRFGFIQDSFSMGNVRGEANIGGFVGWGHGQFTSAYSSGNVNGVTGVGRFIGGNDSSTFTDSYGSGDLTVGDEINEGDEIPTPSELTVINESQTDPTLKNKFTLNRCFNSAKPFLISLSSKFDNNCVSAGLGISKTQKIAREIREAVEARTSEKIEKPFGFKSEAPLPKSAPISFVEPTEKIDLAKVKAIEIAPTSNAKVLTKTGEALQISLKSESKEPVELWVKSADGKWLLTGIISFDKDGKAVLPPLQFKNFGNYSLVLSKPTADSAKGSAPLDQTGSLLVVVS
jgi:hypothetical protein